MPGELKWVIQEADVAIMGRQSLKRRYFETVFLKRKSIYGNSHGC